MSGPIPAVGYARRSSDSQDEASIPDQITHAEAWAAGKGYKLLRWYTDDAISGDDTENRLGFLQMLRDACDRHDFQAIVCWDQARFGRFDSIEAGYYIHPLRKAGVHLATVKDGAIDWNKTTDRIVTTVQQEGKHQQLLDHAHNVARGQLGAMNAGSWVGSPPYGYIIEGPKKHKRLVLGDPAHARIVLRIFREFVDDGRSMTNIAGRLNDGGYPSPGGRPKGWRYDAVKVILENPAYTGDYAGGKGSYGKYHTISKGAVAKAAPSRHRKNAVEWIIARDHHVSIVDRRLFERAQEILARGKAGRSPHAPETNPYVLTGLLRCGRCGCAMHGLAGGSGRFRYYECATRAIIKKNKRNRMAVPEACEGTTVREDAVLASIADHLRDEFFSLDGAGLAWRADRGELTPDDLPRAFAAVKRLLVPPPAPAADRKKLTQRAAALAGQIDKAVANLVLLDAENIPAAQERIKAMRAERAELEAELRNRPPSPAGVNAEATEVLRALWWLAVMFRAAARECGRDPDDANDWQDLQPGEAVITGAAGTALFRRYLRRLAGITVRSRIDGHGTRTRHVFLGGEIGLKPVGGVPGNPNPHLPGKSRKCCR